MNRQVITERIKRLLFSGYRRGYFKLLAEKMAPYGYERAKFIDAVWSGVAAMVKNDGSKNNEEAFWKKFWQYNSKAAECVSKVKQMGCVTVLATNPIFLATATEKRIRWAGLKPDDFELYTTYENCSYCEPNPNYYRDILKRLGAKPEECLMVGNDVAENMVAKEIGMNVFLLTDCLINKENCDISVYPNGSFDQLLEYISELKAMISER